MVQWFFRITRYADRLLEGHDKIDWPDKTIAMQKNWIGRSEGARIRFSLNSSEEGIEVFTTRPDTLWGVTYMVLAPEHPLVDTITAPQYKGEVDAYVEAARRQTEIDRTSTEKEKTGVFTGAYSINPVNDEKVPVWIADYVLVSYGTGAVMAVPGHDERDFDFAQKFKLPIREVISPDGKVHDGLEAAYVDPGTMVQSGPFSGEPTKTGKSKVIAYLDEKGWGGATINYKLRDWLISRQRYWGAPIPVIHCDACGVVPVSEEDLPVLLPDQVAFTKTNRSPLLTNKEWLYVDCPACGKRAKREADTMDTFVCSSWYYLRFLNPGLETAAMDKERVRKWMPVDQYVGGTEHAVMHLMYARFFAMAMKDLGLIDFDEPFKRLIHQGVITHKGEKMAKSKGNVINPDEYIRDYGSDVLRMYIMFMGKYIEGGDWNDEGIEAMSGFVNRVWRLINILDCDPPEGEESDKADALEFARHYAVKYVTLDLDRFKFNTSISRIMELVNAVYLYIQDVSQSEQNKTVLMDVRRTLIRLLAPFMPHTAEEMWERIGENPSIFESKWPEWNEARLKTEKITIPVQINGKVRNNIEIDRDAVQQDVETIAFANAKVIKHTEGKSIKKTIYIKNKLLSIVVK